MSGFLWALIGGPISGLLLEAIGLAGRGKKAVTVGRSVARLLKVIEVAKPRLKPDEQAEAEAAVREVRQYCDEGSRKKQE